MTNAENIKSQIASTQSLQYIASQTGDAGAIFRLEDILLDLYRRLDALPTR